MRKRFYGKIIVPYLAKNDLHNLQTDEYEKSQKNAHFKLSYIAGRKIKICKSLLHSDDELL